MCQTGKLPICPIGEITSCDIQLDTVEDINKHFSGTYFLEVDAISTPKAIKNNDVFHVVKIGGINVKPLLTHPFQLTRHKDEISYGLELGLYSYKVKRYLKFLAVPILDDFMKAMMRGKMQHNKRIYPCTYNFFKGIANKLIGAFGMKITNRIGTQLYDSNGMRDLLDKVTLGEIFDFKRINDKYISVNQIIHLPRRFYNRAIPATVTSKGRIEKDKFERKVKSIGGVVLYGDTDSNLVTVDCEKHPLFKLDFGFGPGSWVNQLEPGAHYTHSNIGGKKSYCFSNRTMKRIPGANPKIAQKGYKGSVCELDYEEFICSGKLIEPPHTTFQCNGLNMNTKLSPTKIYSLSSTSGILTNDGWVLPYVIGKNICIPKSTYIPKQINTVVSQWTAENIIIHWVTHKEVPSVLGTPVPLIAYQKFDRDEILSWFHTWKQGLQINPMLEKHILYSIKKCI
jgi:hypothetical protein